MPLESKPAAECKVLVVDDNVQNVELLEAYLQSAGYSVVKAFDGDEALAAVAKNDPDLILLDVLMPRVSGFEVCRKLKSEAATKGIPIVMVTALNELHDIEKGVEAGTDDFLTKPINKLELLARVKSLLRVRHLQSELDRTLSYLNELEK
jgi:PleD family two-component response regulator